MGDQYPQLLHKIKCPVFNQKLQAMQKKAGKHNPYTPGRKQATETACERHHMLDLTQKNFKGTILSMFKELKETMIEVIKECTIKMSHQIQNFNKKIFFK